jgi:hypothetical protein
MIRKVSCTGVLVVVIAVTGCGSVTPGTGQPAGPSSVSRSADFPSNRPSPPVTEPPSQPPSQPPATSATPTLRPSPATPTRQQRENRLTAQTNGAAHDLVKIARGYEAATFDQHANIAFWRSIGNSVDWTQVGTSIYPYTPAIGGPAHARVTGALLARMQHATFIVTGAFTGDSSGDAVAFTTGPNGWGVIKAEPNGNIGPSGQPVGADRIGLSFDLKFAGGRLVTEDCRTDQAIALCGSNPVIKYWLWAGADFKQV